MSKPEYVVPNLPCYCPSCNWTGLRTNTKDTISVTVGSHKEDSTLPEGDFIVRHKLTCPECGHAGLMFGETTTTKGFADLEERINNRMVDKISKAMKDKLEVTKKKGRSNWYDETYCPKKKLEDEFYAAVEKGDPVDVANYCGMFYARGEMIPVPPRPLVPTDDEGEPKSFHILDFDGVNDYYDINSNELIRVCNTPIGSYEIKESSTTGFRVIKSPDVSIALSDDAFPSLDAAIRHCENHMDDIYRELGLNRQ